MFARERYDFLIVGGGFFGCILAAELSAAGRKVVLCEKEADLLQHASYFNQARVHNGYHYPRSVLTALRSRVNFPRFCADFRGCVVDDFTKLYAVPRRFSKVTARQFRQFMERIGAPIRTARAGFARLLDPEWVEEVFEVVEYAFDAVALKELSLARMEAAGVEFHRGVEVTRVSPAPQGIRIETTAGGTEAGQVLNCTYSQINGLLTASGLERIRLKHELTEMALMRPPEELEKVGVTVMCGPFFSFMPFPPRGLHSLSHVRYTPHCSWQDGEGPYRDAHAWFAGAEKRTKVEHMVRDAARYLPALRRAEYRDSLWEVKTVLPLSEVDDSRPILFRRDQGLKGLTCIMGGKIDNIYDALMELGLG